MGSHHLKNGAPVPAGRIKVWIQAVYARYEVHILRWIDRIVGVPWLNRGRKRILRLLRTILSFLPTSEVVCLERAVAFVYYLASFGEPDIAIGPCRCDLALSPGEPGRMKEMVVLFGAEAYDKALDGYGRLSVEEAEERLRDLQSAGFVPAFFACLGSRRWLFTICHCDSRRCVPMRVQRSVGGVYFPGPDIAEFDAGKCRSCGACAERCHFGAIGKAAPTSYDSAKCLGCGLCAAVCPSGALRLVEREGYAARYYPFTEVARREPSLRIEPEGDAESEANQSSA